MAILIKGGRVLDPAQEAQDVVLGDADDLVRDEPVRLAVDRLHLVRAGRVPTTDARSIVLRCGQ